MLLPAKVLFLRTVSLSYEESKINNYDYLKIILLASQPNYLEKLFCIPFRSNYFQALTKYYVNRIFGCIKYLLNFL